MIDTVTSNGMATELFPIPEAFNSIDVDGNSIEELSCESDPSLLLLEILWPVCLHTGAHKMVISSTMEESQHKDELSVSQAERNVHYFFKSEQWCSSDLSWR